VTIFHEITKIHDDHETLLYKKIFVCSCLFVSS